MSREGSISSTRHNPKKKRVVSSQLRLSKVDRSSTDGSQASSSPTSPHVKTLSPELPSKRHPNQPASSNFHQKTYNGFDIDLNSLDTSSTYIPPSVLLSMDPGDPLVPNQNTPYRHDVTKEELKKASELTSIFLDTRKLLSVERNVVDQTSDASEKLEQGGISNIKISRSTLIRAEKVKTTLAVKYLYIQRTYEWNESHRDTNEHPGVEGVYNPIQIIRNRKIRNKYNEHPQPLVHMKTIPLACNVFSQHNTEAEYDPASGRKKKQWKMMWAIDLNEFIGDPRWRINHWNELKDPQGNLWFPESSASQESGYGKATEHHTSSSSGKGRIFNLKTKHGDKLTDEENSQVEHDDEEIHLIKLRNTNRISSMEGVSSSENDLHNLKISRSKSPKRHKIRNKMKKFYTGSSNVSSVGPGYGGDDSSGSSNVFNEFPSPEDKPAAAAVVEPDPLAKQFFKRLTPPTYDDSDSPPSELVLPEIRVEPTTPTKLKDNDDDGVPDINLKPSVSEVEFLPSDKRGSSGMHARTHSSSEMSVSAMTGSSSGGAIEEGEIGDDEEDDNDDDDDDGEQDVVDEKVECIKIFDERELIFQNIVSNLDYFQQYVNLRSQYLLTIYPNYLDAVNQKVKQITHHSIYDVLSTVSRINDDYLPAYEDVYSGFMEEIKSVIHMVNDVYSIKIDTLLSTSDRSISEINASLSLDLRKITEKLDYLDASVNQNVFHSTLLKKKSNSRMGWIYKVLYSFLENIIIILLRSIWMVVNFYKAIRFIFVALWKFIVFVFW